VVDVEVLECLGQRLPHVQLSPVVHSDDELVEVDLPRVVNVDRPHDCLDISLRVVAASLLLERRHQLFPRNHPVAVRVDAGEHLRQLLPLCLGHPPQGEIALDQRDEVVAALSEWAIT
jgi:hypothetical protein